MRIERWIFWTFLAATAVEAGEGNSVSRSSSNHAVVGLCAALEAIQSGDQLPVVITASYDRHGNLWDPAEPSCGGKNVQPVTFAEIPPGLNKPAELLELLEKDGQATATFSGTLWGPPRPNPDDPALHPNLAFLHRSSGFRRYVNRYLTKLVITEISEIRPSRQAGAPRPFSPGRSPFPAVLGAEMPVSYPKHAAAIGASGAVSVEIQLKPGNLVTTRVVSADDRLLIEDTIASIKTWKFDPQAEATFTTTFTYRLESDLPPTTPSVQVHAELPTRVEIVAPAHDW